MRIQKNKALFTSKSAESLDVPEPDDMGVHKPSRMARSEARIPKVNPKGVGVALPTRKSLKSNSGAKTVSNDHSPRDGSKAAKALKLMSRDGGCSVAVLMNALAWQRHSLRGFVSTIKSKGIANIVSFKNSRGELCYRAV